MKYGSMKKWMALLLTAGLLLGGCGKGNKNPGVGTISKTGETTAESTAGGKSETTDASDSGSSSESISESDSADAESVSASSEFVEAESPEMIAEVEIEAPVISAKDFPKLDGSTATIPLGQMLYRMCTGQSEKDAEKAITFTKTTSSYLALMEGETDLVIAYEAGPKAKENKGYQDLEIKPIGLDALVFLCNEDNPVASLTTQEIQDIYQGKIDNWKKVGGTDDEIIAFQRPENSGSQTLMENLMMQGKKMAAAPAERQPSEMGELIDAVAQYENSANALGYSVYYYASNMYQIPGVRLMGVDGVDPNADTIRSGAYTYVNPFYAAIRKDADKNSAEYQLFEWLTGDDGQSLIDALGYVSVEKGSRVLPEKYQEDHVAFTSQEGRLILDGTCFDGTAGIVVFDEHMKPEKRYSNVRLADGGGYLLARGHVIPASLPMEGKAGGSYEDFDFAPIPKGLFDVDTGKWVVKPDYDYYYPKRDASGNISYYFYHESYYSAFDYGSKMETDVYDKDGKLTETRTWKTEEEVENFFNYYFSDLKTKYEDDATIYYLGGDSYVKRDYSKGEMDVYINGKVYMTMEEGAILPHDSMGVSSFDRIPYNYSVVMPSCYSYDPASGDYTYTPKENVFLDEKGQPMYTYTFSEGEGFMMAGKEFLIVENYEAGSHKIQTYDGKLIYQWNYSEYGETEWLD